jgi:Tfp pilus assembly major pilin PilA
MATMPDLGVDKNDDSGVDLGAIDPIFNTPIGPSPEAKNIPPAPGARKSLFPEVGLTPQQEKYAAGAAGAVTGPAVQRMLEKAFPSEAMRTAEGVKRLSEQQKLQTMLRNLQEEELLRAGIKPADVNPPGRTSGTNWMHNWAGIAKDIEGGVPQASAAYNRMKGQGPVTGRMTKQWAPTPAGEPGQPKEPLVDRLIRQGQEAEASAAQRAAAIEQASTAAQARLSEAVPGPLAAVGRAIRSPVVQGPLAGGAAAMSFYEAYQRFLEGDRSGAVIDALGGIGAIMTMVPGLQIPGLALSLGAAPAQYVKEGLKDPSRVRGVRDIPVDVTGVPTGMTGE